MNICPHAKFQVRWYYGFGSTALQQRKKKKKKKTKNMEKHVSLYFPDVMSKYIFWVNLFFFVCFCLHFFLGDLYTCNEYLSSCKISSSVVLRFWQYSSSTAEEEEEEEDKEHGKTCFAVFPGCYVEIHFLGEFILFCMF